MAQGSGTRRKKLGVLRFSGFHGLLEESIMLEAAVYACGKRSHIGNRPRYE